LQTGRGYWIYFAAPQSYEVCGSAVTAQNIAVNAGWNMIGPFDGLVAVSGISSTPAGILNPPLYEYANGYVQDDVLDPGKGYWAYVNQAGTLHLGGSGGASAPAAPQGQEPVWSAQEFRLPLTVSNGGNSATVSIGIAPLGSAGYDADLDLLAPPAPPAGAFDARLTGNGFDYLMDIRGPVREMQTFILRYGGGDQLSPIVLSWDHTELSAWGTFEIVDLLSGDLIRLDMSANGELIVESDSVLANGLLIQFTPNAATHNHFIFAPMVFNP
jgi:hypothetical protein